MEPTRVIWMDGRMVPWSEATVHVLSHTLHYGVGVFEGIRFYEMPDGRAAIFRLSEHVERLFRSARLIDTKIPYEPSEIHRACVETVRENGLAAGYLRPLVFLGEGEMGLGATGHPVHVVVATWKWGAYMGEEGLRSGVRVCVSPWRRMNTQGGLPHGKIIGNYVNSILAKRQAARGGFQEALLLDDRGYLTEGSGENIFIVTDGVLQTPPQSSPILPGLTRDAIITLARDNGIEVRETLIPRDDLYLAQEIFLTGTAAEVTPIREVDGRTIGDGTPGRITRLLQESFREVTRGGRDAPHPEWRTVVQAGPERQPRPLRQQHR